LATSGMWSYKILNGVVSIPAHQIINLPS